MHEDDRGPDQLPFHAAGDPYITIPFEEAAARLLFLSEQRWPLGWLLSSAGCGKTTLLRHVQRELRRQGVEALLVSLCGTDGDDFWTTLAAMLGGGDSVSGLAARKTVRALLVASSMMNRPITLLLDDADRSGTGVMDQIAALVRMTDSVTPRHTVILATAGELTHDELVRRIDLRADLQPFTREEAATYIDHRLQAAGSPATFDAAAIDALFAATAGVPANVRRFADLALLAAHAVEADVISSALVLAAITELRPSHDEPIIAVSAQQAVRFCA